MSFPGGSADSLRTDSLPDSTQAQPLPLQPYTIMPDSVPPDTIPPDTTRKSKNALDLPVNYSAEDSITFDYVNSRANLYGGGKVQYQNLELEADIINISIDSSLVHATGRTDTLGNVQGKPLFRQGADEYEPDSISYNFRTRKAFISNVYTQQGEGYMKSLDGKRDSMGTMYVKKAFYSTCDAEHPHFYLNMTRAKMRPGKDVVFGPTYLVVEDVPMPLAIPYGFFPFKDKYSSGFIMPSYGDETTRGFYLREGLIRNRDTLDHLMIPFVQCFPPFFGVSFAALKDFRHAFKRAFSACKHLVCTVCKITGAVEYTAKTKAKIRKNGSRAIGVFDHFFKAEVINPTLKFG